MLLRLTQVDLKGTMDFLIMYFKFERSLMELYAMKTWLKMYHATKPTALNGCLFFPNVRKLTTFENTTFGVLCYFFNVQSLKCFICGYSHCFHDERQQEKSLFAHFWHSVA